MKLLKKLDTRFPTLKSKRKSRFGLFECECGKVFEKAMHPKTKSCGCKTSELIIKDKFIHGGSKTRLHNIWLGIRRRCNSPRGGDINIYQNINICDEWSDYKNFKEWSLLNGYSDIKSIDRIDGEKDYSPHNCRWATSTIQSQNRISSKLNTSGYKGVTKKGNRWSSRIGVNNKRIDLGTFNSKEKAAMAYNEYVDTHNLHHVKNNIKIVDQQ